MKATKNVIGDPDCRRLLDAKANPRGISPADSSEKPFANGSATAPGEYSENKGLQEIVPGSGGDTGGFRNGA